MDPTPFGPNWADLRLEDVERFLAEVHDEGLLWEAKGTDIGPHQVRKAVCGFANSHEGGYLILGATELDGIWRPHGYSFPTEPAVWIGQVIDSGIRPRPGYDIKSFEAEEGTHVAIVQVKPTPTPPCIAQGTAYERLPGRTEPVRDSVRLADLFARGEGARDRALDGARSLRKWLLNRGREHPMYQPQAVQCALAVRTAGHRPDISRRLFSQAFRSTLIVVSNGQLGSGVPDEYVTRRPSVQQDRHLLETATGANDPFARGWLIAGRWDGSVGIYFVGAANGTSSESLCNEIFQPAWIAAVRLLWTLGGYGPAYVSLSVSGAGHPVNARPAMAVDYDPPLGTLLDRSPVAVDEGALDLRSIERELDRALGIDAFEPD